MCCHSCCEYSRAIASREARASADEAAAIGSMPVEEPRHAVVVLQERGDRPPVPGQLRVALEGDEERVLLARVVELPGVEPEEGQEARAVLRGPLAAAALAREGAEAPRHPLDEVVLGPELVDQPHVTS